LRIEDGESRIEEESIEARELRIEEKIAFQSSILDHRSSMLFVERSSNCDEP